MKPRTILSVAVIVAAAAIGWAALAPSAPMEEVATTANPAMPRTKESSPPPMASARSRSSAVTALPPSDSKELELLRARNTELESRILSERAERNAEKEGRPIAAPAGLPLRYLEGPLRESLSKALAEVGFKDAKITTVDCEEYPCIAYGEGIGERREFEKLKTASALDAYANDSRQAFGFKVGSPPRSYFGIALVPRDDVGRAEEINLRLRHRMKDVQQSLVLH